MQMPFIWSSNMVCDCHGFQSSLHRQHISFCPSEFQGRVCRTGWEIQIPGLPWGCCTVLHPGSANGGFQGRERVMVSFHLRKASALAKVLLSMPLKAHLNLFVWQFTCFTRNHTKISYFKKGSCSKVPVQCGICIKKHSTFGFCILTLIQPGLHAHTEGNELYQAMSFAKG